MISKTKILVFFLSLFLIAGSAYANAPSPGSPGGPGGGDRFYHHDRLNLTPEQKAKMNELRDNFLKETVFLRNNIRVKRLELRALWTVPNPEKDKIITKQKELLDLISQLQTKATDYRLAARSNLTPEQAALAGMGGPWMGHRGHMGGRMMPGFQGGFPRQ